MKINILGTEYTIVTHKISEDSYMDKNCLSGYCGTIKKEIVIADITEQEYFPDLTAEEQEVYRKEVLRHEMIHAFLKESGLSNNSNKSPGAWAKNEEMVDWFAIQAPKIYKAFQQANCL